MRRILFYLTFSLFFCILNIYAGDIDYKGKYTVLSDALITITNSGAYNDTFFVTTIDDIGKLSISYRLDTINYCYGIFPRAGLSWLSSDSGSVSGTLRFLYPESGKADTLLDSIRTDATWYSMNLDTLPTCKTIAFFLHFDSASTDSSQYKFYLNSTQK